MPPDAPPAGERRRVTIVLLSHNRPNELRESLRSVVEQTYTPRDILVVDNRSDASEEIASIVRQYPEVRLLALPENLGFAGGINKGIEAATGDYVYLTEDDIVLTKDCIEQLARFLDAHPTHAFASPLLVGKEDGIILYAGGECSLRPVFKLTLPGRGEKDTGQFSEPRDCTYVLGGSVLCDRALLRQIGPFRAEFYMYWEDVELSLRACRSGRRLAVVPGARGYHFANKASGPSPFEYHKLKNMPAVYLLHARAAVLPEFIARYGVLGLLRALGRRDLRTVRLMARAWGWVGRNLPALLEDRRKLARELPLKAPAR